VDYKAGTAPTAKNMLEGNDVQLLAYAMMLEAGGHRVDEMGYWKLPHGPHAGDIRAVTMEALKAAGLTDQLYELLRTALAETTPFLARPNAANDRFSNDYDGISRYDEWAG
jgi:RecB family exonuclease